MGRSSSESFSSLVPPTRTNSDAPSSSRREAARRPSARRPHRVDDSVDFVAAHRREERQTDQPCPDSRGVGRSSGASRTYPRSTDGDAAAASARSTPRRPRPDRGRTCSDRWSRLEPQPDREQVPGVNAVVVGRRQLDLLDVGQPSQKLQRDRFAAACACPRRARAGGCRSRRRRPSGCTCSRAPGCDSPSSPFPEYRRQASCDRPCSDSSRIARPVSASAVTAIPPSPVVIVLLA